LSSPSKDVSKSSALYCRRCSSPHLLRLEKKLPQDNEVFRCQECGFLFSPPGPARPDRLGRQATDSRLPATAESLPSLEPEVRSPKPAMGGAGPPQTLVGPGE
jgi:DNA-directed RNA polymerase subunit RPC12/RpoP